MRNILLLLILGGTLCGEAFAAKLMASCETAKTQFELNKCANADFKEADAELNRVYKQIIKEYADDPKFIEKLRKAQRAWIKFRDAEMEAIFPHQDESMYYYGSIFPMCYSLRLAYLTNQRTEELRLWIERTEEGDVCRGSQ